MSGGNEGTQPPTEHRLREAWKKGDTPQSTDLSHAVATLLWSVALMVSAGTLLGLLLRYLHVLLGLLFEQPLKAAGWAGLHLGVGVAAVCALGLLFALLPDLLQSRGRWASKREWIDVGRANPIKRLKSVFALPRLLQIPLALVRLVAVACVAWGVSDTVLAFMRASSALPWYSGYAVAWWAAVRVLAWSSVVCLGIGLLDVMIQRQLWIRRNRMKTDELQKEHKEQEGDPQVKGLRRQLHQESVNG